MSSVSMSEIGFESSAIRTFNGTSRRRPALAISRLPRVALPWAPCPNCSPPAPLPKELAGVGFLLHFPRRGGAKLFEMPVKRHGLRLESALISFGRARR